MDLASDQINHEWELREIAGVTATDMGIESLTYTGRGKKGKKSTSKEITRSHEK